MSAELTTFTGAALMAGATGDGEITPTKLDLAAAEKYVILPGCVDPEHKGKTTYTTVLRVDFSMIKNPYSVRDTSPFKIQVYDKYDAATGTLSGLIQETKTSIIPQSMYEKNVVTGLSLSVLDPVVQEASVQSYGFTTSSDIPGAKVGGASSDMMSAIHIFFPYSGSGPVITKDPNNAATDVVDIFVDGDKSPISGAPAYSVDTSLTYNEFC